MRTFSLKQIRETLIRYVREENLASGRMTVAGRERGSIAPAGTPPGVPTPQTRTARIKDFLRRIPVLGPILVTAYRVIKLPGRVALIVKELQKVHELQVGLTKLHDRVDALSWHVAALQERQETAMRAAERAAESAARQQQVIESKVDEMATAAGATTPTLYPLFSSLESRLGELSTGLARTQGLVADVSQVLVALHEKSDRYQQELYARFGTIKPIFHAGENLIISRVDNLIMAFPGEEWRLPVYQILVGQLEPGLFALMKSTIREGMVVVDIGANVGTYTLLALQAIGTRGKVISYEPTPRVFDILKNNVQINGFLETGRVDLRQKAAADGSQARSQFFTSSNSLMNSLFGEDKAARRVEVIEVETVALDQDLAELSRIDVVKIDAEGAEPAILRGMRRIIERSPAITIFIEFAPTHLIRANVDMLEFLAEIRALGFQIHEVVEPTGELRSTTDEALCSCFSVNLMLRRAG
jgi:FkbM family methyltransferase